MQSTKMSDTKTTRSSLKKLFGTVAAGAFIALPLASTLAPAQATPLLLAKNDRNNNRKNREVRSLEGVVTADRQGRDFTLRLDNGQRVMVRSDEREPRRLSTGDRVRVVGSYRRNQPSVFRADVVIVLTNQNNNTSQTFTGRVSNVDSDQRFDLVVGNITYNVLTTNRLPRGLNEGDRVRVYGTRTGANDISRATVVVINDNGDDNNNDGDYRTFTGRVSNVDSDQRFDIVVDGKTYNVATSSRVPRGLDEDDRVRVYGLRTGDNNIVNATVAIVDNR